MVCDHRRPWTPTALLGCGCPPKKEMAKGGGEKGMQTLQNVPQLQVYERTGDAVRWAHEKRLTVQRIHREYYLIPPVMLIATQRILLDPTGDAHRHTENIT
ncbi:hypothetical protein MSG28_015399 [Choristoneura fumiferana]|uniref:Uncharacterized protein n=1 Tax=Choristoneura fumiferana TaxID=7141 RepID=A0ACC0KAP2_CHOFU|nr:hypothetical protein MSG28_015399 [Choristoneura fumiferana]